MVNHALHQDGSSILSYFSPTFQRGAVLKPKNQAGEHKFEWQATDLPIGIYYGSLKTESGSRVIKMLLLR